MVIERMWLQNFYRQVIQKDLGGREWHWYERELEQLHSLVNMPSRAVVLLAAVVTVQLLQLGCGLKLLSFNIENFSPKKFAKQGVVDVLLNVSRLTCAGDQCACCTHLDCFLYIRL